MHCPFHMKARRHGLSGGGLDLKKKRRRPGLRIVLFGMLLGLALGLLFAPGRARKQLTPSGEKGAGCWRS